jgi:hypothetical protein
MSASFNRIQPGVSRAAMTQPSPSAAPAAEAAESALRWSVAMHTVGQLSGAPSDMYASSLPQKLGVWTQAGLHHMTQKDQASWLVESAFRELDQAAGK